MQDSRVTGVLRNNEMICQAAQSSSPKPTAFTINLWTRTTTRTGNYKSITSERSGKFSPGVLRLNPTTIASGRGISIPSLVYSRQKYANYYYGLTGCSSVYMNYPTVNYYDWGAWDTNLESLSFVKSKAKLKDAELEMGVMLGELTETLGMLRNPVKALTDEMYKLYKFGWKNVRKGQSFMDALTGGWLTYRYGILPLVADISAVIAYYHKKFEQVQGLSRQKAGVSSKTRSMNQYIGSPGRYFSNTVGYHKVVEVKSTSHIYYQKLMEADMLYKLRLLGLHTTQLPSAAWELVTLSFVVDWFLAVGDWLKAITPDWNAKHLGNCTTQKITVEIISEELAFSHPGGIYTDQLQFGKYSWKSSQLIRKVGTTTPVFPPYKPVPLNLKRSADSLALLWGRILKPVLLARR